MTYGLNKNIIDVKIWCCSRDFLKVQVSMNNHGMTNQAWFFQVNKDQGMTMFNIYF